MIRKETRLSPWVRLVENEVPRADGAGTDTYHSFAQADYVTILARTPDGRIPVVRQFRPAVARETWELPAGLVESGEDPAETCRRELREETGLTAITVRDLGSYFADTARLENAVRVFVVETGEPDPAFVPEPGVHCELLAPEELRTWIRDGKFAHQIHIGAFALAALHGFATGVLS